MTRPRIESLEDRRVPATWGITWPAAQQLTLSFVPDGTQVQGQASQLYQTLDGQLGAGLWEIPIIKAFQTWASNSDINIGLVPDGGQPEGTAGPAQGDPRFGDIRISAKPLPAGVLAISSPYDPSTGTLSGDMILNSSVDFNTADSGAYDLFTVALHEAGHVFGFADSSSQSSFMYNVYGGPLTGLAPGAVPALQASYGGTRNLNTINDYSVSSDPNHPANVPLQWNNNGSAPVSSYGDLATSQGVNSYQFQLPGGNVAPNGVDVQIQALGISFLTPTVTVSDPSNRVVATASAADPLAGGVSVHLAGLIGGQKYSIRVAGATGDVLSVGTYRMTVSATKLTGIFPGVAPKDAQPIQESGDYNGSSPLVAIAGITQGTQADLYSFRSPVVNLHGVNIQLQDTGVGLAAPQLKVFDALGKLIGSASGGVGTTNVTSVFLPMVLPGANYYVQVTNGTLNSKAVGIYQLTAAFNTASISTTTPVLATPWINTNWAGQSNATMQRAAHLASPAGSPPNSYYSSLAGLSAAAPQGFFAFQSPNVPKGQSVYLTATVESLQDGGVVPVISVFDQNGNSVAAQVLSSQGGVAVVKFPVAQGVGQYSLEVSQSKFGGGAPGNYLLTVTSGSIGSSFGTLASGTLPSTPAGSGAAVPQSTAILVSETAVYQFVLAGGPANSATDAILTATILDNSGNVVSTLTTAPGEAASMIVFLSPGSYTILIAVTSRSGMALDGQAYSFYGDSLTDPIKPYVNPGGTGGTRP